ncbi:ATP-binding protein [Flavobacterium sp. RHBU_24]|uniref:GAF domain-containing sensor histidine kinase n=1 Tax=Flavobacterium sp. RHBU_24 TaxID=3391185 RepID=UPI0039849A9C
MNATNYGMSPAEEKNRLKELRSFDILDTLTEKDYEDITTLASIICDVPIALISLVDSDRQWFKSHRGLPIDETHRQYSFCSHAILTPDKPFIVEDSRLDDRFKDNPYVTGSPNIVFYAGIPLVSESGYGMGTVCIIDDKPHTLTPGQVNALQILAGQVMHLLELRKANLELGIRREMLEIKNKNLDKIVAGRVAEIEQQNLMLENMNKELQAFTYISSHDLQEPLRKIQTFISMISEREYNNLSEKGREYFAKIEKAAGRMSLLIKDLLAYSRTTTSKQSFDDIRLSNLVNAVTDDMQEEIKQKNALVILTSDGDFKAISFQFRQVIYNLLSNSLKFSRPGTPPEIKIGYKAAKGYELTLSQCLPEQNYHIITFQDNGIGFNSLYKDKIFGLFQRLETKNIHLGTGIGLAIVKKIIDNHSGHIDVASTPDEGTLFTIILPFQ